MLGQGGLEPEMEAWWIGQLRRHLVRFDDVREHWLSRDDVRKWIGQLEIAA